MYAKKIDIERKAAEEDCRILALHPVHSMLPMSGQPNQLMNARVQLMHRQELSIPDEQWLREELWMRMYYKLELQINREEEDGLNPSDEVKQTYQKIDQKNERGWYESKSILVSERKALRRQLEVKNPKCSDLPGPDFGKTLLMLFKDYFNLILNKQGILILIKNERSQAFFEFHLSPKLSLIFPSFHFTDTKAPVLTSGQVWKIKILNIFYIIFQNHDNTRLRKGGNSLNYVYIFAWIQKDLNSE